MKKKNLSVVKWVLGILIFIMAALYSNYRISENALMNNGSKAYVHRTFFQYLENLFGFLNFGGSSNNNLFNQNNLMLPNGGAQNKTSMNTSPGSLPNAMGLNTGASQGTKSPAGQGSTAGNTSGINTANNAQGTMGNALGGGLESNTENNSGTNAESNSGTNAENNSGNNTQNNAENNSGNNPTDNTGTSSDQGTGNQSSDNSGGNSGENSGNNSGSNSGDNSGNGSGNSNQNNLPTINPIPSDDQVSQSVTNQNQQNDNLAALLAQRQVLVAPVQQQAQASKYQTVNSQNIPAPSTNQPPQDVVAKMKSNQVMFH